jgi:hypothetical protein
MTFPVLEVVTESTTLAALRALSSNTVASLSSAPWWRRPIQEVLNQLFQRPLPRKPVVTIPRRAARAAPAPALSDRPMGRIVGGSALEASSVEVERGALVVHEGTGGPFGVDWRRPTAP